MCVFCDIVKRKQAAYVVDETEKTMTILDIEPANEGHVLIIPKIHVDSIVNLPDAYVQEITSVIRRIIKAFMTVYHASGYGMMQNGGASCDFGHLHSNNLYQIFTYVKNREYQFGEDDSNVSGMLLYAKTDAMIQPDNVYQMHGNQISIKTLDLNLPFEQIKSQLDKILEMHFGEVAKC